MNFDRNNIEHAHIRIDSVEQVQEKMSTLVESHDQWQKNKDRSLEKIKNWIIGGIIVYVANTIGVVDLFQLVISRFM
jgi:hypothetical protein